jgi:hypothetical protein
MARRCRPPDMSNFCCLPGRAGGTPIGVQAQFVVRRQMTDRQAAPGHIGHAPPAEGGLVQSRWSRSTLRQVDAVIVPNLGSAQCGLHQAGIASNIEERGSRTYRSSDRSRSRSWSSLADCSRHDRCARQRRSVRRAAPVRWRPRGPLGRPRRSAPEHVRCSSLTRHCQRLNWQSDIRDGIGQIHAAANFLLKALEFRA